MSRVGTVPIRVTLALCIVSFLLLPAVARAEVDKTTTRPISDFVSTQGTYCFDDGQGGCIVFVPPVANFIGWDNSDENPATPNLCAAIDYAGLADAYILSQNPALTLQTRTTGIITERLLDDGRALVEVRLQTKNALTWVIAPTDVTNGCNYATDPLLLGNRAPDVLTGAQPVLCNASLDVTLINTSPGAPLPDLIQLLVAPAPGQEGLFISIHCNAHGTLSDGTPATASIMQTLDLTTFEAGREVIRLNSAAQPQAAVLSALSIEIVEPRLFVPLITR